MYNFSGAFVDRTGEGCGDAAFREVFEVGNCTPSKRYTACSSERTLETQNMAGCEELDSQQQQTEEKWEKM